MLDGAEGPDPGGPLVPMVASAKALVPAMASAKAPHRALAFVGHVQIADIPCIP